MSFFSICMPQTAQTTESDPETGVLFVAANTIPPHAITAVKESINMICNLRIFISGPISFLPYGLLNLFGRDCKRKFTALRALRP